MSIYAIFTPAADAIYVCVSFSIKNISSALVVENILTRYPPLPSTVPVVKLKWK